MLQYVNFCFWSIYRQGLGEEMRAELFDHDYNLVADQNNESVAHNDPDQLRGGEGPSQETDDEHAVVGDEVPGHGAKVKRRKQDPPGITAACAVCGMKLKFLTPHYLDVHGLYKCGFWR